jgi:hypothetical protein
MQPRTEKKEMRPRNLLEASIVVGWGNIMSAIEETIDDLARGFAKHNKTLDVRRGAFGIWTSFPDAPFTLDEMIVRLGQAADRYGTTVFIDNRSPGPDQVDVRVPDVKPRGHRRLRRAPFSRSSLSPER